MNERAVNKPLPGFNRPPVAEVAVSVQFEALPSLRGPQLMLWWGQIRDQFPRFEEQPPLPSVIEGFEPPKANTPRFEVQILDAPPPLRYWMIDALGTGLIQVQQDRFVYNWKKLRPEDDYPRYAAIRKKFLTELTAFEKFLSDEKLGNINAVQCEVTYVNQISTLGVWQRHGELHRVIPSVTPHLSEGFLPEPEATQLNLAYVITGAEGKPVGRLHVTILSTYLIADMSPIFVMQLTARGAPQGPGQEGILRFLDLGHEWIVRGFTTLTSPEMHRAWGRAQ